MTAQRAPRGRNFANLTPERRKEISSLGGKAAHAPGGNGRQWTPEEARAAARKGAQVRAERRANEQ